MLRAVIAICCLGAFGIACGGGSPPNNTPKGCTSCTYGYGSSSGSNGTSCHFDWDCCGTTSSLTCDTSTGTCSCNDVGNYSVNNACNFSDPKATANQLCGWKIP